MSAAATALGAAAYVASFAALGLAADFASLTALASFEGRGRQARARLADGSGAPRRRPGAGR